MKRLAVYLNDEKIGLLADVDELVFTYDEGWLAGAAPVPLSRQLPLQSEAFRGRVVRAFFGGLLPEADSRERIGSILGISAGNDFALLERIGGECAGAVSLLPEGTQASASSHGDLRWLSDAELAAIVQKLPRQPLLAGESGLRLSLAGAQVKLPVVIAENPSDGGLRVALPLDGTPSTHIVKPEPARFPGLVANEAWCLALARHLGLNSAEAMAHTLGEVSCLIVKRYDREMAGNEVRRLHQEDFCQAMGFPATRKYQQEGGPSLRECFALVRDWSTAPVLDINRLLDAVIFAAIIGNADAHAKNHSFLYPSGARRMAPLYDQVCTLAWPELSKSLSMKIGSAGTLSEVSPEHFRQLCAEAGLGWPMVRERLTILCMQIANAIRMEEIPILKSPANPMSTALILPRAERMLRLLQATPKT